jgi:uncharacterized membrane protein
MGSGRLEAFSDGVLAIAITIMVLELKAPEQGDLAALRPLLAGLFSYVLSFLYLGIYWSNHHHVFQATNKVDGAILWANLHLLFWLSLIPFVTRWMGGTGFGTWPVAAYGGVLFMCAVAWDIERRQLIRLHEPDSPLVRAMRSDFKERLSMGLYAAAVAIAFFHTWAACAMYAVVAVLWFVPDLRVERELEREQRRSEGGRP